MLGDRLAHRLSLLRIRERRVECGAGHTDRTRRDVDATDFQRAPM